MAKLKLVLGNKNYSSWSLRPWLAMRQAGIAFDEEVVPLDFEGGNRRLFDYSPAGRVPVLFTDDLRVWESLAILEYVAELFPEKALWPEDRAARAHARTVSAEMHAGFAALRAALPMNIRRPKSSVPVDAAVENNIARVTELWADCRERFGADGPFLFGGFTIADAMFAPVVTRLDTYSVAVDAQVRAYMEAVLGLPAFAEWKRAADAEPWVIEQEEI